MFWKLVSFKQIPPLGWRYCHGKINHFLPPLKINPHFEKQFQRKNINSCSNVNHCIIISFWLKHQDQFYESFFWTTLIVLSQNLKSSRDIVKILLNSTQDFLIIQTQKKNNWLEIMDTLSNSKVKILYWLVHVLLKLNHQLHNYFKKHETELLWSYQTKENSYSYLRIFCLQTYDLVWLSIFIRWHRNWNESFILKLL